jgi:glycosyltransferase involved in cell wall biosynthesis
MEIHPLMQEKFSILVVHEVSYERKVVYEIHEFPEIFLEQGHQVSFIDFDEDRPGMIGRRREEEVQGRAISGRSLRVITPFTLGHSPLDRLVSFLTFIPVFFKEVRFRKPDFIFNYAVPTYGAQLVVFAKLLRIPVIHRALDSAHKIRVSAWNPLIRVFEKFVYRHADMVSANNIEMAKYVSELSPTANAVRVNNPPLDVEFFSSGKRSEIRRKIGIPDTASVILYMGSFFYFSNLAEVILKFSQLEDPNLRLVLIGGGEQDSQLRALADDARDSRIIFTGYVDYRDLPDYLAIGDVAINPLEPAEVANVAFPHKVLQYMAASLPVVSRKLRGLYATFDGELSPVLWADSTEHLLEQCVSLLDDESYRKDLANSTKIFVSERYSYGAAYTSLMDDICDLVNAL